MFKTCTCLCCYVAFRGEDRFISELETLVKHSKTIEIVKDAGWYSEAEMKTELKWNPSAT